MEVMVLCKLCLRSEQKMCLSLPRVHLGVCYNRLLLLHCGLFMTPDNQ